MVLLARVRARDARSSWLVGASDWRFCGRSFRRGAARPWKPALREPGGEEVNHVGRGAQAGF